MAWRSTLEASAYNFPQNLAHLHVLNMGFWFNTQLSQKPLRLAVDSSSVYIGPQPSKQPGLNPETEVLIFVPASQWLLSLCWRNILKPPWRHSESNFLNPFFFSICVLYLRHHIPCFWPRKYSISYFSVKLFRIQECHLKVFKAFLGKGMTLWARLTALLEEALAACWRDSSRLPLPVSPEFLNDHGLPPCLLKMYREKETTF